LDLRSIWELLAKGASDYLKVLDSFKLTFFQDFVDQWMFIRSSDALHDDAWVPDHN
jgi:hypothetical protein